MSEVIIVHVLQSPQQLSNVASDFYFSVERLLGQSVHQLATSGSVVLVKKLLPVATVVFHRLQELWRHR